MPTRIATVGYLNAKPLTEYLDREDFEVSEGHPSEIARSLREGEVDLALVPVAAALTDGAFRIVPEVCIGAEGEVHSVLLVAETPPEEWTVVVLDAVSRTSRTLARLLLTRGPLSKRLRPDVEIVEGGFFAGIEQAAGTTAGLVIGDRARDIPDRLRHRFDLAEQWFDWTGLPFVFAVWAGRPDLHPSVIQSVIRAGHEGLSRRASDYTGADHEYVTRYIRYDLDDRALMGLRRYAALAHADGLIGTEEVQLFRATPKFSQRANVDALLAAAADGASLSTEQLISLAREAKTADLVAAASLRRGPLERPESRLGYRLVVTNVDVDGMGDWVDPTSSDGFVLTAQEVESRVRGVVEVGITEVVLDAGLHPGVGIAQWVDWIRAAVQGGAATVLALSVEMIRDLSAMQDQGPEVLIQALKGAGLTGLAEGPTLALDPEVRRSDRWCSPAVWTGMVSLLSEAGLHVQAGLEVGAGESLDARVEHLVALSGMQKCFSSVRVAPLSPRRGVVPAGATAEDMVRTVALARLVLHDVGPHEAGWMPGAPGLTQFALQAGADAVGTVFVEFDASSSESEYENPRARIGKPIQRSPVAELRSTMKHLLKQSGLQFGDWPEPVSAK